MRETNRALGESTMYPFPTSELEMPATESPSGLSRRSFFQKASVASAAGAVTLIGLVQSAPGYSQEPNSPSPEAVSSDGDILLAAEIAEALAVTTYTNIVGTSGWFTRLPDDDQGYLYAARNEEMSHYALEKSATGKDSPFTTFYYPKHMFADAQTTLNTLVALEDAFIAAYLVGVRFFSTADLRVTAARIMGVESDHRTLARSLAGDVAPQDGGPIAKITGLQGVPENVHPPNNNGYERTQCWTNIQQAVTALLPFVDKAHATVAGFDTTKPRTFEPFSPHLATTLGNFISFTGC
jgi:Ferritin-like domain